MCFFLGAVCSCVVALHTARDTSDPVRLYCAAAIRSVSVWPDIFFLRGWASTPRRPIWFYPPSKNNSTPSVIPAVLQRSEGKEKRTCYVDFCEWFGSNQSIKSNLIHSSLGSSIHWKWFVFTRITTKFFFDFKRYYWLVKLLVGIAALVAALCAPATGIILTL